jgi:hypothetical protein
VQTVRRESMPAIGATLFNSTVKVYENWLPEKENLSIESTVAFSLFFKHMYFM